MAKFSRPNLSTSVGLTASAAVATFSDIDPGARASDFTAMINWGDGSPASQGMIGGTAATGFVVSGIQTYTTGGKFTASVIISNVNGLPPPVLAGVDGLPAFVPSHVSTTFSATVSSAPLILVGGPPVTYNSGGSPVAIAPTAALLAEDGLFAQSKLSVIDTNSGANDWLGIRSGGGTAVSGSTITDNGTAIGTFTAGAGSTPLNINFNNSATEAAVLACCAAAVAGRSRNSRNIVYGDFFAELAAVGDKAAEGKRRIKEATAKSVQAILAHREVDEARPAPFPGRL